MKSQKSHSLGILTETWVVLALCVAVVIAWAIGNLVRYRPAHASGSGPDWLPVAAAVIGAAGIILSNSRLWPRMQKTLLWGALLLMVWVANGLPLDLLRLTPLIPLPIDWPGLATKTLALAVVVVLARLALARPANPATTHAATWYGYAALVLALTYPFLRTVWAFGGTLGLMRPGAAGEGFVPWLACVPWLFAAVLSRLLVVTPHWMQRRLLLVAGWSGTVIVAMIGPAAVWSLINSLVNGETTSLDGIAAWIPWLFYGSWFLWAIAAGAATRSYQLRSAASWKSSPM